MILNEILTHKRKEVEELKLRFPIKKIRGSLEKNLGTTRGFAKAISLSGEVNLIAEIKKASPSAGILKKNFNPLEIARLYEAGGAKALSILTEIKYFLGRPSFLKTVNTVTSLPLLRKDFILDSYQIYESRLLSADAILLIADILTLEELKEFSRIAEELGMDALVEVHSEEDMKKAKDAGSRLIGINNRNLRTLKVSTTVGEKLIPIAPKGSQLVIESGIEKHEEIQKFKSLGVSAFLVGTSLMRAPNVIAHLHHLRGIGHAD